MRSQGHPDRGERSAGIRSPWFAALVNTTPTAIIGAGGAVENQVDLAKSRKRIMAAVILASGFSS